MVSFVMMLFVGVGSKKLEMEIQSNPPLRRKISGVCVLHPGSGLLTNTGQNIASS